MLKSNRNRNNEKKLQLQVSVSRLQTRTPAKSNLIIKKALDKRCNLSGLVFTLEQRLRREHGLQMVGLTCPKWSVQFNLQDLEKVATKGHLTTRGQGHSTKTFDTLWYVSRDLQIKSSLGWGERWQRVAPSIR